MNYNVTRIDNGWILTVTLREGQHCKFYPKKEELLAEVVKMMTAAEEAQK